MRPQPEISQSDRDRFWSKVEKTENGCWTWRYTRKCSAKPRHANFAVGGDSYPIGRIAWWLTKGPIPDGLNVCHTCDNGECANPAHLFLGANSENMQDALAKGRLPIVNRPHPKYSLEHKRAYAAILGKPLKTKEIK